MRGITKRVMGTAAAAAGAFALVVSGSGAAHASSFVSGSVSVTVTASWYNQLRSHGVILVPQHDASLTYNSAAKTYTVTFTATGGDANLGTGAGSLQLAGGLLGFSCHGKTVSLGSLEFDMQNAAFDGATSTSGATLLADLGGSIDATSTPATVGNTQVITSSDLDLDAAGAALLDSALGTTAFVAGASIGSFSATWTN